MIGAGANITKWDSRAILEGMEKWDWKKDISSSWLLTLLLCLTQTGESTASRKFGTLPKGKHRSITKCGFM